MMAWPAAMLNLAAECRAVEEGHRCRLAPNRDHFLVRSDTRPVTYEVKATSIAGFVVFACSCPWGEHHADARPAGVAGCKHAALVARRLEREGLAAFDGAHWKSTPKAEEMAAQHDYVVLSGIGLASNFEVRCSCGFRASVATLDRAFAEQVGERHAKAHQPMTEDELFGLFDSLQ